METRSRKTGRTGAPRTLYLGDETMELARSLGEGSASEGIRRALDLAVTLSASMQLPSLDKLQVELHAEGHSPGAKESAA